MNPERVVRRGAWVTFGVAGLYLAGVLITPVGGAALAVLFAAFGWGILRRQAWAATGASAFLIAPIFLLVGRGGAGLGVALAVGIEIGIAWLPVWAAVTLWRHREIARFNVGWLAATLALILAACVLHPYALTSGSMANTILRGDYVLCENVTWRLGRTPHDGDVVQVRHPINPKQILFKRVVGVPGDRLRLVNKQLYRNGAPVAEPYAIHASAYIDPYRDNFPSQPSVSLPSQALDMLAHVRNGELIVPAGQYFVLGDNRDDSLDSRYWGFVSRAEIVGSPLVIYASYDVPPQAPAVTGTILTTRWNRLLKRL